MQEKSGREDEKRREAKVTNVCKTKQDVFLSSSNPLLGGFEGGSGGRREALWARSPQATDKEKRKVYTNASV